MLVLLPAPVRAVWLWWRPFFDRLGRNRPFNTTTFRLRTDRIAEAVMSLVTTDAFFLQLKRRF